MMSARRAKPVGLELTLIAQLYLREHGEFPEGPSAFVPEYLNEWPIDPTCPSPGGPMVYERESPTSARIRSQAALSFDVTLQTR